MHHIFEFQSCDFGTNKATDIHGQQALQVVRHNGERTVTIIKLDGQQSGT